MSKETTVMNLIDYNEKKLELLQEWQDATDEATRSDIESELEAEYGIDLTH